MKTTQTLLGEVHRLQKHYRELSKYKGENFNIFSILGIERDEVRTHNRFIAHLLNPKGSHNMEGKFLQLFIQHLIAYMGAIEESNSDDVALLENVNLSNARVIAEYYLGTVDLKNEVGGSVDICITLPGLKIHIENKIDAGEQDKQLIRYYNSSKNEKVILIYLTLWGRKATTAGDLVLNKQYFNLSHRDFTTAWLQDCLKESADFPILRETIKQYLILLKKLTNQSSSKKMEKELFQLLTKNVEQYNAAKMIAKNFESARKSLYAQINQGIQGKLSTQINVDVKIDQDRGSRVDGGFIALKSIQLNGKKYDVGFNLELLNNFYFFCVVEHGKNRNAGINSNALFDHLATYLHNNTKNAAKGNRSGWSLTGTFPLEGKFTIESYLEMSESERTILLGNIGDRIADTYKHSNLADYMEMVG